MTQTDGVVVEQGQGRRGNTDLAWLAVAVVALITVAPFAFERAGVSAASPLFTWLAAGVLVLVAARRAWLRWQPLTADQRRAALTAFWPALVGGAAFAVAAQVAATAVFLARVVADRQVVASAWQFVLDPASLVPLTVMVAASVWAVRRITPTNLATWRETRALPLGDDEALRAELTRTRRWRTLPAVLAAAIAVAPAAGYSVALRLDLDGDLAAEILSQHRGRLTWVLPLAVYVLGVVVAEATRRHPGGTAGIARLDARRPASYLSPLARRLPVTVGLLLLAGLVARLVVDAYPARSTGVEAPAGLVVVLGLTLGASAVQRWVVRRPQRLEDPVALAYDDTFRSSAAHALVGGSAALGLVVLSDVLDDIWTVALVGRGLGWLVGLVWLVGVALFAAAVGVWLGLGSSHRGRRPSGILAETGGRP